MADERRCDSRRLVVGTNPELIDGQPRVGLNNIVRIAQVKLMVIDETIT